MGLRAKKDFRQINFKKSVMAGDSFSDLLFGKRLKMKTVYINRGNTLKINDKLTDFIFPDLRTFALEIFQNSTVG
jgi:histidinol phosphatase-like enzyme